MLRRADRVKLFSELHAVSAREAGQVCHEQGAAFARAKIYERAPGTVRHPRLPEKMLKDCWRCDLVGNRASFGIGRRADLVERYDSAGVSPIFEIEGRVVDVSMAGSLSPRQETEIVHQKPCEAQRPLSLPGPS